MTGPLGPKFRPDSYLKDISKLCSYLKLAKLQGKRTVLHMTVQHTTTSLGIHRGTLNSDQLATNFGFSIDYLRLNNSLE